MAVDNRHGYPTVAAVVQPVGAEAFDSGAVIETGEGKLFGCGEGKTKNEVVGDGGRLRDRERGKTETRDRDSDIQKDRDRKKERDREEKVRRGSWDSGKSEPRRNVQEM